MSAVVVCAGCGNGFVARKRMDYGFCRERKKDAQRVRLERSRARARDEAVDLSMALGRKTARRLTVVSDPLGDAGFKTGHVFFVEEWKMMLRFNSFTPGTILMDGQSRLYRFEPKELA